MPFWSYFVQDVFTVTSCCVTRYGLMCVHLFFQRRLPQIAKRRKNELKPITELTVVKISKEDIPTFQRG